MNTLLAAVLVMISQVILPDGRVVAVTLTFSQETCKAEDTQEDGFRVHQWCVDDAHIPSDEVLFAKQTET